MHVFNGWLLCIDDIAHLQSYIYIHLLIFILYLKGISPPSLTLSLSLPLSFSFSLSPTLPSWKNYVSSL